MTSCVAPATRARPLGRARAVPAGVTLQLFSSGTLEAEGFEVPVPFFHIRHPEGDIVVDGGNPLAVAQDVRAHWGPLADVFKPRMSPRAALRRAAGRARGGTRVDPLRRSDPPPHRPHRRARPFSGCDGAGLGRELAAARAADPPHARGYVREDFEQAGADWRESRASWTCTATARSACSPTPGHSAGHTSLLLELPETGPVLLTADASDNRAQWEGRLAPRALSSREDAERSLEDCGRSRRTPAR